MSCFLKEILITTDFEYFYDAEHHAKMSLERKTFNVFVFKDNFKSLYTFRISTRNPSFYYVSISTAVYK